MLLEYQALQSFVWKRRPVLSRITASISDVQMELTAPWELGRLYPGSHTGFREPNFYPQHPGRTVHTRTTSLMSQNRKWWKWDKSMLFCLGEGGFLPGLLASKLTHKEGLKKRATWATSSWCAKEYSALPQVPRLWNFKYKLINLLILYTHS